MPMLLVQLGEEPRGAGEPGPASSPARPPHYAESSHVHGADFEEKPPEGVRALRRVAGPARPRAPPPLAGWS